MAKKSKEPLFKIIPDSIVKAGGRGYQYCQTDPPHPNGMVLGDRKARYIYLHVARMELSIGRFIRPQDGEEVHHKDGDVSNNVLSNLELKNGKNHQREHAKDKQFWKKSPRTHKRKASDHLRRIAKCLCQITDVGKLPAVDQVQGTIILDRNCPDHKNIGRDEEHSERDTETSIKPKMAPEKRVASQYLSEIMASVKFLDDAEKRLKNFEDSWGKEGYKDIISDLASDLNDAPNLDKGLKKMFVGLSMDYMKKPDLSKADVETFIDYIKRFF